jgi:hypothetical protein
MRLTKFFCAVALCAPFMLVSVGCGEEKADQMATDDDLAAYGKKAAKGTVLEGLSMGDGEK